MAPIEPGFHLQLPRHSGLVRIRKAVGVGRGDGCARLALRAVDPGEDDVVPRVEARILRRDEDSDRRQPGAGAFVATIVEAALERFEPAATAAAVETIVSTRKRSTGQIQSPGYHARWRCHHVARKPTTPRFVGKRVPHSRQYSWSGSY